MPNTKFCIGCHIMVGLGGTGDWISMRAIEWMQPYKERYESFLNTGNAATDKGNAILLHSEGDGSQYPSLFAVYNAEGKAVENAGEAEMAKRKEANNMIDKYVKDKQNNINLKICLTRIFV